VPYGALHVCVFEGEEVIYGLCFRGECGNIVRLEAVDELTHVVCLALYRAEHGPIADGAVGAQEDEVVGEVGGGEAEVRAWFFSPCILEVGARGVDDREARLEGGVEARGADEYVDGVFGTVVAQGAARGDGVDFAVNGLDVGFAEGFEVADAGSEAAASDVPIRDQALFEVGVIKLRGHLLAEVGFGLSVDVGVLEENAELAVEAALDVATVLGQGAWLGGKLVLLMLGVDVLL
jgi:hypothetical protein